MWWHGGAGLAERSERGSLSAVATHDVFALAFILVSGQKLQDVLPQRRKATRSDCPGRRRTRNRGHQTGPTPRRSKPLQVIRTPHEMLAARQESMPSTLGTQSRNKSRHQFFAVLLAQTPQYRSPMKRNTEETLHCSLGSQAPRSLKTPSVVPTDLKTQRAQNRCDRSRINR